MSLRSEFCLRVDGFTPEVSERRLLRSLASKIADLSAEQPAIVQRAACSTLLVFLIMLLAVVSWVRPLGAPHQGE